MGNQYFRYFPDYETKARFSDSGCDICGKTPALDGLCFGDSVDVEGVCVECLTSGRIKVEIPDHVVSRLADSVNENSRGMTTPEIQDKITLAVEELSKTPPAAWIQYNDWAVCEGDFAVYVGEWGCEKLTQESPTADGKGYLSSILDPFSRSRIKDIGSLWTGIENGRVVVFVFECPRCSRRIATPQWF
jgi:uncharacterized protein CbrC (UPF0167 family)